MKKLIALILSIGLSIIALPALGEEPIIATLPGMDVYVSYGKLQWPEPEYPVLEYDGVVYMPMTWQNICRFRLCNSWVDQSTGREDWGWHIAYTGIEYGEFLDDDVRADMTNNGNYYRDAENLPDSSVYSEQYELTLPDHPIYLNGRPLDNAAEEHPILFYRGIHYLPISELAQRLYIGAHRYNEWLTIELSRPNEVKWNNLVTQLPHEIVEFVHSTDDDTAVFMNYSFEYFGGGDRNYYYDAKTFNAVTGEVKLLEHLAYSSWGRGETEIKEKVSQYENEHRPIPFMADDGVVYQTVKYTEDGEEHQAIKMICPDGITVIFEWTGYEVFELVGLINGRPLVKAVKHLAVDPANDGFFTLEADGSLKKIAPYDFRDAFTAGNRLFLIDNWEQYFIDAVTGERISYITEQDPKIIGY
ncbi:MAG: hypothetical protein J1F63_07070 [Oscillospiraceae bacterium]|nr:hypothetical protein [Oscillospiraceae bacterium]